MSAGNKVVLVTGATGKVGQNFIQRFLNDPDWQEAKIRALCHNRMIEESDRIEVVRGSISQLDAVTDAMKEVTHVVHLAT